MNAERKPKYEFLFAVFIFIVFVAISSLRTTPNTYKQILKAVQGSQTETTPIPPNTVETAFSPYGGGTDLIVKTIGSARKTLHLAAYTLTSRPIAKALVAAYKAGVDVAILVDHSQISSRSLSIVPSLAKEGIPIRADVEHTLQHNKYMIIDQKTIQTGSFNYTAAAENNNAENVLVIWGSESLAATYEKDWTALWEKAEPYKRATR